MSETATLPAHSAQLECPKCHYRLTCYDLAHSTHCACPDCHNYFELRNEQLSGVLGRFTKGPDFVRQVLPLGATGTLPDGLSYRVLGYSARAEAKSIDFRWGEYVLFSAPDRYAQLAVYEGHWTFIRPDSRLHRVSNPKTREAAVEADDHRYELYNKYSPRIHHAAGEFNWNIRQDEALTVQEFIDPPYMLVREQGGGQPPAWYLAEHLEPAQVAEAFGVPAGQLPEREGVGAVQPAPGEPSWQPLLYFSFGLALLAVLLQLVLAGTKPSKSLLQESYVTQQAPGSIPAAGQSTVIVTPSFEVHGPTALYFQLWAGVDNQWLELPVSLVNERTGQGYEFTKTFEYYHGYEDGESWSEGSADADATLTNIPAGRYHLNLYPQSENAQSIRLRVGVTEHPTLESNLLLLLLVILAFPVVQYLRRRLHAQTRWSNSDYGPTS
ncbi:DUF4178 domain-containing protein [Hymenobacter sp. 15J16-1T3B]|uniref:DUF4178 domain-containing protein n=1 Tax=Hymenobacter sp. 15J16-1T3B TaxID=2886941 RepID=UPI001D10FFF0|nr:DUF4178 domain-containing protein [Hymenobacter sp. 15J16-1T3B]MCC3160521.1 DUF4178 domain-containing protein [Hymenobacter sp. 15J16-1T3B]